MQFVLINWPWKDEGYICMVFDLFFSTSGMVSNFRKINFCQIRMWNQLFRSTVVESMTPNIIFDFITGCNLGMFNQLHVKVDVILENVWNIEEMCCPIRLMNQIFDWSATDWNCFSVVCFTCFFFLNSIRKHILREGRHLKYRAYRILY